MLTCQHCQTQTQDGAIFCDLCGHELTPVSQRVGWTHPPVFGANMPATPVAPMPQARITGGGAPVRVAARAAERIITLHVANGPRFSLSGKSDYLIGRASADSGRPDVDLGAAMGKEAGVSRRHLMLHVRPDGVFVEDLESRNETVHNGYRLLPQQWYPLRDGDELRLGATIIYVSFQRP